MVRHLRHRPARVPRGPDLHPAEGLAAPADRRGDAGGDGPRVRRRRLRGRRRRHERHGGRPGRRRPYDVCGECPACAIGRYNICRKLGFVGLDGQQGGFAEKCVVGARWAHPLGDIPTDLGALVEPLAVAYHAVRLSGLKPGDTAAVFGSGPIGLVTTAALKAAGAAKVFVVEPAAVRKAKAPGAGADEVLDPTEVERPVGGEGPHRRGRRRRVRVRGRRRRPRLGDRVGAAGRDRRQRGDLGPRGPRRRQRARVLRDQPHRDARLLRGPPVDHRPPARREGRRQPVHHRKDRARRPGVEGLPRADRQQGGERQDPGLAGELS